MVQLEKEKKEAAIEEDFEKALECKKAIKDLQVRIDDARAKLIQLFEGINNSKDAKPRLDRDLLLDILDYEERVIK